MGLWWHVPFMGGRGRITEFEARLVYRVSSRTARATQRTLSRKKRKEKKKRKETLTETQMKIL